MDICSVAMFFYETKPFGSKLPFSAAVRDKIRNSNIEGAKQIQNPNAQNLR